MESMLLSSDIESATRVQNSDEVIYASLHNNALGEKSESIYSSSSYW